MGGQAAVVRVAAVLVGLAILLWPLGVRADDDSELSCNNALSVWTVAKTQDGPYSQSVLDQCHSVAVPRLVVGFGVVIGGFVTAARIKAMSLRRLVSHSHSVELLTAAAIVIMALALPLTVLLL